MRTGAAEAAALEERILDETGDGVDLVLEMSGAEAAINQALRIARMGGAVSLLGIPTRQAVTIEHFARDLIFKGLDLHAIIGRRIFSTWDRMLALMLTAPFLLVRQLIPSMYERRWGRIINVGSVHSLVASPYKSAYVSAKHGLVGLTKTVALEAAEKPEPEEESGGAR